MVDFWDIHGIFFILFMFLFPRLTMLFATTVGGGLLYWFGWFFCPGLVVAILATTYFWQTNTVLCIFTWIWAFSNPGKIKIEYKPRK